MAFNENHATRCYDGQSLKERHPDLSQPFPKVRRGQRHKRGTRFLLPHSHMQKYVSHLVWFPACPLQTPRDVTPLSRTELLYSALSPHARRGRSYNKLSTPVYCTTSRDNYWIRKEFSVPPICSVPHTTPLCPLLPPPLPPLLHSMLSRKRSPLHSGGATCIS